MFISAFEKKLLLNSFLVLIMRNFISETGALERLPGILAGLPTAAQISPTHVCLVVASEQYGVTMGQIIRQTIPRSLLFCGFMVLYYNILIIFK